MKNLQYIWIVVLCLTLISCGREIVNSDVNSTTETPNNTEVSEKIIQGNCVAMVLLLRKIIYIKSIAIQGKFWTGWS